MYNSSIEYIHTHTGKPAWVWVAWDRYRGVYT